MVRVAALMVVAFVAVTACVAQAGAPPARQVSQSAVAALVWHSEPVLQPGARQPTRTSSGRSADGHRLQELRSPVIEEKNHEFVC
jgi:hypothetical protein